MEKKNRIKILDVLRVIAIVMVMLSHYYNNYPEIGRKVAFGALGVPLFFIISGFVIYSSLQATENYKTFLIKRFLRLSPAMLICSTITFTFFRFIYTGEGYGFSKEFSNYLIANTFIDPNFINIFLGRLKFYYIDNAYWSLWVEISFYTLIGFLYYFRRKSFIPYYIVIVLIGTPIFYIAYTSTGMVLMKEYLNITTEQAKYYKLIARGFPFFGSGFWFIIGIYLYRLHKDRSKIKYIIYILLCLLVNILLEKGHINLIIFGLVIFSFMMTFVYYPQKIEWLCHPLLCRIGVASYSMYLIHYHLGMVLVKYLNDNIMHSYLWPFFVAFLVIIFGLFSYNYIEKPLGKFYKKIFKL